MKEKNRAWKILLNILICTIGALTVFSAGILFSKNKLVMNDTGIEAYYGVYEIKEFLGNVSYLKILSYKILERSG